MHGTEARQSNGSSKNIIALGLGALLSLGIELIILLLGSIAVSSGILRPDTQLQMTAAACLIGCFVGGGFTCRYWRFKRLLCGLLTGVLCFVLIFVIALVSYGEFEFGSHCLIEMAGCLIGGGLAGMTGSRKSKKKKRIRQKKL